jgi:hypothetical protein
MDNPGRAIGEEIYNEAYCHYQIGDGRERASGMVKRKAARGHVAMWALGESGHATLWSSVRTI